MSFPCSVLAMLPVAKHIVPPSWMRDYRSVKIMRALGAYEAEPQALFVGGCVRNSLLGKPVSDIDIATEHPEFREWRWIEADQLPELIVPFKRDLYRRLVAEFRPYF